MNSNFRDSKIARASSVGRSVERGLIQRGLVWICTDPVGPVDTDITSTYAVEIGQASAHVFADDGGNDSSYCLSLPGPGSVRAGRRARSALDPRLLDTDQWDWYNGKRVSEQEAGDTRWMLHRLETGSPGHSHVEKTLRHEAIRRLMRLPDYANERHLEDDWLYEVADCVPPGRSDIMRAHERLGYNGAGISGTPVHPHVLQRALAPV